MMDFIAQHKLVSMLILVLLIAAAWWGFTQSSSPSAVLAGTEDVTDSQDSDLVSSLLELQTVNLTGAVLSDPGFLALQDFTTQIVSEPIGRPNPFAPLSSKAPVATSTPKVNPGLFAPAKH